MSPRPYVASSCGGWRAARQSVSPGVEQDAWLTRGRMAWQASVSPATASSRTPRARTHAEASGAETLQQEAEHGGGDLQARLVIRQAGAGAGRHVPVPGIAQPLFAAAATRDARVVAGSIAVRRIRRAGLQQRLGLGRPGWLGLRRGGRHGRRRRERRVGGRVTGSEGAADGRQARSTPVRSSRDAAIQAPPARSMPRRGGLRVRAVGKAAALAAAPGPPIGARARAPNWRGCPGAGAPPPDLVAALACSGGARHRQAPLPVPASSSKH